jgi:hypothetical protein
VFGLPSRAPSLCYFKEHHARNSLVPILIGELKCLAPRSRTSNLFQVSLTEEART